MKKHITSSLIVLLLAITVTSVMRESDVKSVATELQEDNENMLESVTTLEKELEVQATITEKLLSENEKLIATVSKLEEENGLLKTSIDYQDFNEAVTTVESYKSAKTFEEIYEFFLGTRGLNFSQFCPEGKCSFDISFNGRTIEWVPNTIQELKDFKVEGEKIYLTYHTNEDIKHYNYQFVLAKGEGMFKNQEEAWRIESIERIRK
ncbi:hypothetical protein IMZ08_02665 [Bacillus luteolus]|uniref:Uncharacterized protein n=1 Tax=Litchfieldia luteola TaxID=682179 RepID=A0ABR9QFD5_9BACI|nr:hypothetical protein [Cytobacillus luteolus]MBE4906959.1 hypothetical protein [Cytobacillus luteolus]MBP1943575.1 post-segregation antitoxin (ccd killing protein) [Cytobacillus luteolus]